MVNWFCAVILQILFLAKKLKSLKRQGCTKKKTFLISKVFRLAKYLWITPQGLLFLTIFQCFLTYCYNLKLTLMGGWYYVGWSFDFWSKSIRSLRTFDQFPLWIVMKTFDWSRKSEKAKKVKIPFFLFLFLTRQKFISWPNLTLLANGAMFNQSNVAESNMYWSNVDWSTDVVPLLLMVNYNNTLIYA